jgi:hypothetical protein
MVLNQNYEVEQRVKAGLKVGAYQENAEEAG